ncbi:MAG: glycosyltransferase family 2 protein [Bacteroidales bacterium]|nr:glycosyltransferase family 2 protein [Bacteroidales bacterium]
MSLPLLSVVVCTCNRAELLPRAIDSILSQKTPFNFEIIIIDDHSIDNTPNVVVDYHYRFPSVIRWHRMETNVGVGAAWATGVKMCRGRYLTFLDDDDRFEGEERFAKMVAYIEDNADKIDLLYTDGVLFDEAKGKEKPIEYPTEDYPNLYKMWRGEQLCIQLNMMMVKREVLLRAINLDDYIKYRFPMQDWNTNILLLKEAKTAFMHLPSVVLYQTKKSLSRSVDYDKIIEKQRRESDMCSYLASQFPNDNRISHDKVAAERYTYHILTAAAYQKGDYHDAKIFAARSEETTLRVRCTGTWLTFQMYRFAHFLRAKVRS